MIEALQRFFGVWRHTRFTHNDPLAQFAPELRGYAEEIIRRGRIVYSDLWVPEIALHSAIIFKFHRMCLVVFLTGALLLLSTLVIGTVMICRATHYLQLGHGVLIEPVNDSQFVILIPKASIVSYRKTAMGEVEIIYRSEER